MKEGVTFMHMVRISAPPCTAVVTERSVHRPLGFVCVCAKEQVILPLSTTSGHGPWRLSLSQGCCPQA
jgi:hypothetical protein